MISCTKVTSRITWKINILLLNFSERTLKNVNYTLNVYFSYIHFSAVWIFNMFLIFVLLSILILSLTFKILSWITFYKISNLENLINIKNFKEQFILKLLYCLAKNITFYTTNFF